MYEKSNVVQYIKYNLSLFLAYSEPKNLWNKQKIADHVTMSETIGGTITASTLGRFLKNDCIRVPHVATTRMMSQFLIEQNIISHAFIETLALPPQLRSAFHVTDFLSKETKHGMQILKKMAGEYDFQIKQDGYLLEIRLTIEQINKHTVTLAQEKIMLCEVVQQQNTLYRHYLFSACSNGVVVGAPDFIAVLLRDTNHNQRNSVLNIHTIGYEDQQHMHMCEFKATRNSSWDNVLQGQFTLGNVIDSDCFAETIAYHLAQDVHFRLQDKNVDFHKEKMVIPFRKSKDFHASRFKEKVNALDIDLTNETLTALFAEADEPLHEADKMLLAAMKYARIQVFEKALESGANPNLIHPVTGDPVVFVAAQNLPSVEWFNLLFATGECDMTRHDQHGLMPSYYIAESAEFWKRSNHPVADVYYDILEIVEKEQEDQFRKLGASGKPFPSSF